MDQIINKNDIKGIRASPSTILKSQFKSKTLLLKMELSQHLNMKGILIILSLNEKNSHLKSWYRRRRGKIQKWTLLNAIETTGEVNREHGCHRCRPMRSRTSAGIMNRQRALTLVVRVAKGLRRRALELISGAIRICGRCFRLHRGRRLKWEPANNRGVVLIIRFQKAFHFHGVLCLLRTIFICHVRRDNR